MSSLAKIEFSALRLNGENYLAWTVDARIHLKSLGLRTTIEDGNTTTTTEEQQAKALHVLRRHVDEHLRSEYLLIESPKELWDALEARFNHQKEVMLPKARSDWTTLRFQDFK